MKKTIIKITLFCLLLQFFYPTGTEASEFDPNYVLSDIDLENSESMSLDSIQRFLERGSLFEYKAEDIDGIVKTAAEIIYRAATDYTISPKYLLVLLQKEQSLIEDDDPTEKQLAWATGYAICDSCSMDDEWVQKYKGFANQVEWSAKKMRESYLTDLESGGETWTGWGPGIERVVDDLIVTPLNNATAALYTYTPHLHGNENLWKIWNRWFSIYYPNGSLLMSDSGPDVYYIKNDLKHHITSFSTLISRYDPGKIISVDPTTLDQYDDGATISFPNYSLLRTEDETIYLIVDDAKRPLESMEVFRAIGFVEDEIVDVLDEDLAIYEEGKMIYIDSVYPQGALVQDNVSGGIYYVKDGYKHSIYSKEIMTARFASTMLESASPDQLEYFPTAEPVLFNDGELIKITDEPTVYIVDNGRRRPIPSEEVFLGMHWEWQNVIETNEIAVNLHAVGDPFYLTQSEQEVASY